MVIFHSYVSLPEGMSCFVFSPQPYPVTRIDGSSQRFNAPQLVDGESLRAYAHRQPCHKLPEQALPRNTHDLNQYYLCFGMNDTDSRIYRYFMAFHEIQRLTQRTSGAQAARQYYRQAQGNQIYMDFIG